MKPYAALSFLLVALASPLASAQDSRTHETFEALDALVDGGRLVTLERARCTAAQSSVESECAALVGRSLATWAETFRTAVPIPVRGFLQLDVVSRGFLLRAHDRAALFARDGRVVSEFRVPTSTLARPMGLREVQGAVVLTESDRCSAVVFALARRTRITRFRGTESHIYPIGGGPHDTVCFGFSVTPVGELGGLILVAASGVESPEADAPTILAFDARGVERYRVPVGQSGAVFDEATMRGRVCTAESHDGNARARVSFACRTGRAVASPTVAPPATPAPAAAAGVRGDRRGILLGPVPRCVVVNSAGSNHVRFDGREVLATARDVIVMDQQSQHCLVDELADATHPADVVHRFRAP